MWSKYPSEFGPNERYSIVGSSERGHSGQLLVKLYICQKELPGCGVVDGDLTFTLSTLKGKILMSNIKVRLASLNYGSRDKNWYYCEL